MKLKKILFTNSDKKVLKKVKKKKRWLGFKIKPDYFYRSMKIASKTKKAKNLIKIYLRKQKSDFKVHNCIHKSIVIPNFVGLRSVFIPEHNRTQTYSCIKIGKHAYTQSCFFIIIDTIYCKLFRMLLLI